MARDKESGGKAGQVTSGQEAAGDGVPFDTSRAHMARAHRWRPGAGDLNGGRDLAIYAGVGRKP